MALKFCRALPFTSTNNVGSRELLQIFKFVYEFWCYCINGGASPTAPGGLPATTPSNFPANFLDPHSGTTVLMASGTDGATTEDDNVFTSVSNPFTVSMVGKYLVTWKPNSGSSEDSIYQIVGFDSAGQIRIQVQNGGTPSPTTLKPRLTSRTSICYRVVDVNAASVLAGFSTGQYMVLQLTPPASNPGQANSQIQFFARTGSAGYTICGMAASPAGTWNGSAFTDSTGEFQSNQVNSGGWFGGSGNNVAGLLTMIGDKDGMILHQRDGNNSNSGGYHFEIPYRIYSQAQDPNPVAFMLYGNESLYTSSSTLNYGGGFVMRGADGVGRKVRTLSRTFFGNGFGGTTFGNSGFTAGQYAFSVSKGKVIVSDALLSAVGTANQYALARARLRYVKFVSASIPTYARVGDNGEYLHLQSGICWPWDNTILGYNLLALGI